MGEKRLLAMSSSPHIRSGQDTRSIMGDVLIACVPALCAGVYLFGVYALLVVLTATVSCVFFEWAIRRALRRESSVRDLSAAVTGMLLGFCMPPTIPLWVPVAGSFFAIVVVKQLYGGIGKNFLNPALAARCFLFSWPVLMTTWAAPRSYHSLFNFSWKAVDAVTSATPLAELKQGVLPSTPLLDCFLGNNAGSIGEVSVLALLLGAAYLLIRGVINLRIPGAYLLTVAALSLLFPQGNPPLYYAAYQLCSGGLMLGACFMANDYVTSPSTVKGQIIYGIGCGALTVFIRRFGSYAEGVSFAILIMNTTTWLIDKVSLPRRFGVSRAEERKLKAERKEGANG